LLGERFFVLYGDSYLPIDYGSIARAFLDAGKPALMTVFKNDGRWDTSNVWFEEGRIRLYDKASPTPKMRHIDYGLGVLSRESLSEWKAAEAFDLASAYRSLIATNELAGCEVTQRFYEVGSPEGLAELDALLTSQPAFSTS
jgi:NDP-sugar pyrophosphorylase family protein